MSFGRNLSKVQQAQRICCVDRDAGPSFIDAGFERRHIGEVP